MPYDDRYWQAYRELDQTPMAEALTQARCDLVARHWNGNVVDVGIGGGRFVGTRHNTYGFDINPSAVEWLKAGHRWWDPFGRYTEAVTCWDSLEHMLDPSALLNAVSRWIFVSIPIFRGAGHVLQSKHMKPGEHFWYFSDSGLRSFMAMHGWSCAETNDDETLIGREDIKSYAFRRT